MASRGQRTVKRQQRRCSQSRVIERVGLGSFVADLHGRQRSKDRYASFSSRQICCSVCDRKRGLSPLPPPITEGARICRFLGRPLWSAAVLGFGVSIIARGLRACLTVRDESRPPSALIWDLSPYPQTYPQVWGGILANFDERVKILDQQTADFIEVPDGREHLRTDVGAQTDICSAPMSALCQWRTVL